MSTRIVAMGLIEAIDRADPTRSHELKPSQRMIRRRQEWHLIRSVALAVISAFAFWALVIATLSH